MSEFIRMLGEDKEINDIKKEWLRLGLGTWKPFNFDEYLDIDDYKAQLKKEFERLKKLKSEQ